MTILTYDPYTAKEKAEELGAKAVEFDALLKDSDVITIHVPLTEETHHMIGKNELGLMKRTAVIVNTSRGGIIDETALYDALKEKRIARAALDVTEKEPLDLNNPLCKLDNVIITPHIAGSTEESVYRMSVTAAENIVQYFKGAVPIFVINKEVLRKIR
jgi:D-3-phosphoglycerate dehydrogenase